MGSGGSIITLACDACGARVQRQHRRRHATCRRCYLASRLIYVSMRYWGARIILGMSSEQAMAWSSGSLTIDCFRVMRNRLARKRYAMYRAQGLSSYEAMSRLRGPRGEGTAAIRRRTIADVRRRNVRWGGCPKQGSRAWVEREAHKLAVKLGAVKP